MISGGSGSPLVAFWLRRSISFSIASSSGLLSTVGGMSAAGRCRGQPRGEIGGRGHLRRPFAAEDRRIETLQLWRIKDIDFQQTFWDRILGVARIFVFTKDVTTPVLTIVGLPGSRALFDQMKDAIEAARQSRNLMGIVE